MLDYKGEDIAVAYACAYPLAVVAIIATSICLRFIFRIDLKEEDRMWEEAEKENNEAPIFFHVKVTNAALEGKQLEQLRNLIGRPFICSRLLHKGTIISPHAKDTVHVGDVMRIVASAENKDAITVFCGSEDKDVDLATESSPITARNIRVTRSAMNGLTVHDLHLSRYDGVNITRIFRAGMTLFPYPHLRFQIGDVVYCVGPERSIRRLADKLGNQEKKLDHPNLISIFLGIAVGILFGSLPIAIPGMPVPLKLGLAGGPLIVAILLGYYGPNFKLITYTTASANLMLREMGIALFLASVGLAAGRPFVDAIVEGNGLLYAFLGLFITIILRFVHHDYSFGCHRKYCPQGLQDELSQHCGHDCRCNNRSSHFGLRQHADGKERIRSCIFNGLSLGDVPANPFRSVRSAHPLAVR